MARGLVESHSRPVPSAKVPLRLSLVRLATLIVPLAAVEWIAYPLLLHDSSKWWLSYIIYLALGVILPGTLVAQAFVRWRADWLTWIGIGWALGHALEVVSILVTKTVGLPRLFLLWIPLAYVLAWRKRMWDAQITAVSRPAWGVALFAVVVLFASATFVALNLDELSPQPYSQSDVWFHVNEAHEFRDHLDTSDPRIAGRPYAYHTLEYGPSVGANLAVQVPLANLVTRYSGLSLVWLLVLLLFNSGRHLRSAIAGFLSAAMIVAPLDVFSLISSRLSFGSSIIYSGIDLSTSTLVGFGALAGLFLPLRWFFTGGRLRDLWVVALLAYVAAGSKSVPGPLLLIAAGAVVGGAVLRRHRPTLRSMLLVGLFAGTFCVTALPILLRSTVADSATITFASTARLNPYADQLIALPSWFRLGIYPIGFCLLLWIGATVGIWELAKRGEQELCWFVGSALLASAVIVQGTSLAGHSELFFLYMAMVLIAPVAGYGLCELGRIMWRGRKLATPLTAFVAVCALVGLHLAVGGRPSAPLYDGSRWAVALRGRIDAGVQAYRHPGPPSQPTSYEGGQLLRVTPGIVDGLSWLRRSADSPTTVIATNVPGAALYAALCECREYYQTDAYAPEVIQASRTHTVDTTFADRERHLQAWMSGEPGSVELLRKLGISYLIVDHVNGLPVATRDMPPPSFSNGEIAIYKL